MPINCYNNKKWVLSTEHSTYALGLGINDYLTNLYYGPRLFYETDIPEAHRSFQASFNDMRDLSNQEYPTHGGMQYFESCLKINFEDGTRDLVLNYDSYSIKSSKIKDQDVPTLEIYLKDSFYPIRITLFYQVFEQEDIIDRYAIIENLGENEYFIDHAYSGAFYVPDGTSYRLSSVYGRWAGEFNINRNSITPGKKILESRRGSTSHSSQPWFTIDDHNATEAQGNVWFGALHWSGNWKIVIEETPLHQVRIMGGLNDFDFRWHLTTSTPLQTPKLSLGYTNQGFGQASRNLHQYQYHWVLPSNHAKKIRKVLYNSWEATYFDVNEENQFSLAQKAAEIGVELFVMDDGWFGQRNTDRAGLGDWYVNSSKFPNGLSGLIQKINDLGMDFGLWVEPEMVNPDSDLYRKYPDWIFNFPNRESTQGRFQYNLNVAIPEVKQFIFKMVDDLLSNYNITFIKWDWNKSISEAGWPKALKKNQQEVMVHYIRNLYDIFQKLREKHPNVTFETCSGGGGRVDMGILSLTDQAWISDNTGPYDRLFIQEGYSNIYNPKTMVAWVTDWGDKNLFSLKYRFHSAMMGVLGIGANLNHFSDKQLNTCKKMIKKYKEIRHIIQDGDLYRLLSPRESPLVAVEYLGKNKQEGIVFLFLNAVKYQGNRYRVRLAGLDPMALYKVKGIAGEKSGNFLMEFGMIFTWDEHLKSDLITFSRV